MIDTPPETPPRPALNFTVAWTVFAMLTFLAVGSFAQIMQPAWGMWFSEIIVLLGLSVIGYQLVGFQPLRAMGLQRFDGRALGLGFGIGLLNYLAWAVPLIALTEAVFPKEMLDRADSSFLFLRATPVELVVMVLAVSIAAPLGEEFFFRGFLQRGLEFHRGAPRAIVFTAVAFSAFHLDVVGLTVRFELGILFGLLAWRSGSLWPSLGAHAAHNFISIGLLLANPNAERGEANVGWVAPLALLVLGNAALFALVRFSSNWFPVKEPMDWVATPERATPAKLFRPWVVAGLVAVALILAVDLRGVQLNLVDVKLQTGKSLSERPEVKALRAKVRRGEAELGDYERLVRSLKI